MSLAQREDVEKQAAWNSDDSIAAAVAGKRQGRGATPTTACRSCSPLPPMPPERSSCACRGPLSHSSREKGATGCSYPTRFFFQRGMSAGFFFFSFLADAFDDDDDDDSL
jgi:hypothetical protein